MSVLVAESGTRALPTIAAHTIDAMKIYGRGQTEVRALDGITVEFAGTAVHRHHGAVRVGQVHAAALHRRARTR